MSRGTFSKSSVVTGECIRSLTWPGCCNPIATGRRCPMGFVVGLVVGLGVAVAEYFVLKNNPKYLHLSKIGVEKLDKWLEDLKAKLGKK